MEYAALNNGVKMPKLGLGTFKLQPSDAEEGVYNALVNDYRLIEIPQILI